VKVKKISVLIVTLWMVGGLSGPHAQQQASSVLVSLAPTNHPFVPAELSQLWLVPRPGGARTPALEDLSSAVKLEVDNNFAKALPLLSKPALGLGPLGRYAEYYKGVAEFRLGRVEEARRTFQALRAGEPVGFLAEAAALREAECAESLGDYAAAVKIYARLADTKTTAPDDVLMRLGRAATAAGDREKALQAFARVYYDFPLSDEALSAGAEVARGPEGAAARLRLQLERIERLFAARRYDQARTELMGLRAAAQGDDRELIDLRLAECEVFLKRARVARDLIRPYVDHATRQAEALYFHGVITRDLGSPEEFVKIARRVVTEFPSDPWAEEALNSLALYADKNDDYEQMDQILREQYERFPKGRYAERSAWRIGWWAQRTGRFADTARVFAKAAVDFPRSDYRPAWLYWAGRAHEALNEMPLAEARYLLTTTDYLNTYYGRLAAARLLARGVRPPEHRSIAEGRSPTTGFDARDAVGVPPNAAVIRALLELQLYDQAVDELRYAQKVWRNSPSIDATLAWTYVQQGRVAKGNEQFNLLRGAINAMKRAYPQYLTSGGEGLPAEILKIIFPLSYWDLIRKYSAENNLDPFLVAALISQESTFVPDIRSYANAVGLTQLMAPTARQYAKTLNLTYSPRLLTNPETNIRIGLAYLAAKIREFGEVHLALASYNAGERPVHRWVRERGDLEREEFIDDIPYPQTQNYVKKILATAEDYRRLYGSPSTSAGSIARAEPAAETTTASTASTAPKAMVGAPRATKASTVTRSTAKKKRPRKAA
jgi:peptidoglycan lytic transglycosylase